MVENNPYSAPSADVVPDQVGTGSYGGMGRLRYFLMVMGASLLFGIVAAVVAGIAGESSTVALGLLGLGYLGFIILVFWIAGQRFRNIGRSPWNCLWLIVPLANFYFGWMVISAPEGYADHKKLDTAGVVMTVLYVLMVLGSIAVQFMIPQSTLGGQVGV